MQVVIVVVARSTGMTQGIIRFSVFAGDFMYSAVIAKSLQYAVNGYSVNAFGKSLFDIFVTKR
jgi:hypothetical protein